MRLAGAFGQMWFSNGYLREAEMWLERMLALDWQAGEPEAVLVLRATALYIIGDVLLGLGKVERAEALATEFLERARPRGDQFGMSSAWIVLGMVARARGKLDEAATFFAESDTHARLTEHLSIKGMALRNRADLAWIQGDLARATTFAEEGRLLAQSAGITFVVAAQTTMLGHLARQQGKYALAKTRYREALALYPARLAIPPTAPGVWRAWPPRSAQKRALLRRPACAPRWQRSAAGPNAAATSRACGLRADRCQCASRAEQNGL